MKKIKKIKTSVLSRQFGLMKIAGKAAGDYLLSKKDQFEDRVKETLAQRAEEIVSEFSLMKGSVMKAGQMLSLYGEHFFPKEVNDIFKRLQSNSTFLDWETIKKEIPIEWFEKLDIEQGPLAAASIGQVHKAIIKESQEVVVLKIQYPGVKKAIESDIKALKLLFNALKLLPREFNTDGFFHEIKDMLYQETNYHLEADFHEKFSAYFKDIEGIIVPKLYREFSTDHILCSEFIDGYKVDAKEIQDLSDEKRNLLGHDFFKAYFHEIFHFSLVQTDAHLGNYLVTLGEKPKLCLLDFGATKEVPEDFLLLYRDMIRYSYTGEKAEYKKTMTKAGFIDETFDEELFDQVWDYVQLVVTPLRSDLYDYGASDLPSESTREFSKLISKLPWEKATHETLFLDRKLGGVFIFLKALKAQVDCKSILEEFLQSSS